MARYIDCDKCYHRYACAGDTDKWNYYGECPHYTNSADVVPRSEYEELELKLEAERSFKPLAITLAKQEVASEIFDVLDKKKRYLMKSNNYNLFKASMDFFDHIDDFVGLTGEEILAELEKKYIGEVTDNV